MSRVLFRIHRNVESQHPVEQRRLAIKMMFAEPTTYYFLIAVLEQGRTRAAVGGFGPPIANDVLSHVPVNIAGSGIVQRRVISPYRAGYSASRSANLRMSRCEHSERAIMKQRQPGSWAGTVQTSSRSVRVIT